FWFMEMNTRLQVEHPVTEMVTGLDLVEWQLRVAAGEVLPLSQKEIRLSGHAVEARLYAEDAARGFLPATGTLHHLVFPETVGSGRVRVDSGVRAGDAISTYYDPMIAKLIVHAENRAAALAALREALAQTRIAGSTVNTAFLAALAADPHFQAGDVDTGMIARSHDALVATPEPDERLVATAALAASGAVAADPRAPDPWDAIAGYRHFGRLVHRIRLEHGEREIAAEISARPDGRYTGSLDGGGTY